MNTKIVQTTLDILRDTADDIEREDDLDTTTIRLVIRASATTLEAEIKRLKDALGEGEHQTHSMRVWGGESWTYPPPQAGKIAKFARAALDA